MRPLRVGRLHQPVERVVHVSAGVAVAGDLGGSTEEVVTIRLTRSQRGERPVRLLGVYARPSAKTAYLDALAGSRDVDLALLYATRARAEASKSQALRHVHWFPRSVRISGLDRALGRDYPVHWAIWKSFHALRPDCMIIAGWDTFATQAAIAWCIARRVPYVLLIDEKDSAGRANGSKRWQRAVVDAAVGNAAAVLVPGRGSGSPMVADAVGSDDIDVAALRLS